MKKGADISPCGEYRYRLWRQWTPGRRVVWIMLNPSTADASLDDPTIRRCMGFTKEWGIGGIEVINLFALRSSSPKDLLTHGSPMGIHNDHIIMEALCTAKVVSGNVIAAWGALKPRFVKRALHVVAMCTEVGIDLLCLGQTKGGHPRHPLYVRKDQKREEYP